MSILDAPGLTRVQGQAVIDEATAQANAAADSATAAGTSATDAANRATAADASQTAAATSETNAASSATAAGNSATAADASQTAAATSETNAANSAAAASTSATDAASSAAAAQTSQTAAHTSELNAANSATAAANSVASLNSELPIVTTGGTTTLSATDAANGIFKVTGALTSAATIVFPASAHNFTVQNLTTGAFSLTIQAAGQTPSATVVQGKATAMFADASGVYAVAATTGVQFAAAYSYAISQALSVTHLGALVIQTATGTTATLPPASTYPAGAGVAVKNASSGANSFAVTSGDTCEVSVPHSTNPSDVFFLVSDGVSKWSVGWYSNPANPTVTSGLTFPDGTTQTTANGTTAPASQWYTVGPTDTIGSFAIGDTALRTSGFNAPFVEVKRGGLWLTRGQHYTLNADGLHINGLDPLTADDQIEVLTKVIYSPSTVYSPLLSPLSPAIGATTIQFAHVQGFAPLMNNGAWLTPGADYTEDATGYTLNGWAVGANDNLAAWNLTPITLANMLSKVNPTIGSGPLTFADGSQQNTAALSNRNYIVDGNFEQWVNNSLTLGVAGYSKNAATMYANYAGLGGNATISKVGFGPGGEPLGMTVPNVVVMKINQTVASTGDPSAMTSAYVTQFIESVVTLNGRSATFSCWLWCDSGTMTIPYVEIYQNMGTGGSPSTGATVYSNVNWLVTTTPKRFSARLDFPSIAGKTLGTTVGTDMVNVALSLPNNVTFSLNTAQWQLEQSSPSAPAAGSPTPFEYRGQQAELARVQRYYEVGVEPYFYGSGFTGFTAAYGEVRFSVTKRAAPAVSCTNWKYYSGGADAAFTPATPFTYPDKFSFQGTGLTNWCGWDSAGNWVADARL